MQTRFLVPVFIRYWTHALTHPSSVLQLQRPRSSAACQQKRFVTPERTGVLRSALSIHTKTHLKERPENVSVGSPPLRQELTRPPSNINCAQMFTGETWARQQWIRNPHKRESQEPAPEVPHHWKTFTLLIRLWSDLSHTIQQFNPQESQD